MLHNAAVSLGNRCHPESAPALLAVLQDPSSGLARSHAVWALEQLGAVAELEAARKVVQDPELLLEIEAALRRLADESG